MVPQSEYDAARLQAEMDVAKSQIVYREPRPQIPDPYAYEAYEWQKKLYLDSNDLKVRAHIAAYLSQPKSLALAVIGTEYVLSVRRDAFIYHDRVRLFFIRLAGEFKPLLPFKPPGWDFAV